jgi:indolepyruvate ferredoxin oxidoreductase, beta subunit
MSSWTTGQRPITLAILAMGGEGGGVLSDWIVAIAEKAGYAAQNTSVAGVAQRTGATIYYVELFPPPITTSAAGAARAEPVLSTMPTPGEVDIVIASELMEAGRAIQRGFVTPDRTTLIASTNRVYSIAERISPGDGRVDSRKLLDSAERASKRFVGADFSRMAEQARSVISAALLGALAGSGALPFAREDFEAAVTASGKAVERSLAAFAAGFTAAERAGATALEDAGAEPGAPRPTPAPVAVTIGRRPLTAEEEAAAEYQRLVAKAIEQPESMVGPRLRKHAQRVSQAFPGPARAMLLLGCQRTALYQDVAYADRYLDRVARLVPFEPADDTSARLTTETARYMALWMCYQDTIQVAAQKTRRARLGHVRQEARADDTQLVQIREYLHPQLDEITDTMPTALGRALARSAVFRRLMRRLTHKGMVVNTTSLFGYTVLSLLARLRPVRPHSLRFEREQRLIDEWLELAIGDAATDYAFACEIIECARVLKGYGATYAHGRDSFSLLMRAARALADEPGAAGTLAKLRAAALADEDGAALRSSLAQLVVA